MDNWLAFSIVHIMRALLHVQLNSKQTFYDIKYHIQFMCEK